MTKDLRYITRFPTCTSNFKTMSNLIRGEEIMVIIDETGDKKKGKTTDYIKRQYIGNLGKIENGIVAVTAYGLLRGMTFPLIAEVYKPRERLKEINIKLRHKSGEN